MIVKGGATLSERVADGSVTRALTTRQYKTVVLQERGGDLICPFVPDSCDRSLKAIQTLATSAQAKGASPVLLGTYQTMPRASQMLVENELAAATSSGIAYIEISETLQALNSAAPQLAWFYSDGIHPGKDLALLDAVLIYKQLYGSYPTAKSFTVHAPIYTSESGLTEALREAASSPPKADTPREISYPSETIERMITLLEHRSGS